MRSILAAAATLIVAGAASAQDLFAIDTNFGGIRGTGNDVVSLIDDVLNREGVFSGLTPVLTYQATLNYLGVENAVVLDLSNFGRDLTLTIPSTGAVVDFSAATPSQLEDQVEDWLKQSGVDTWAKFLQAMNGEAPLAVLDGNPRATTALLANSAYHRFGLYDSHSRLGYREQEVSRFGTFGLTVEIGGGSVSTDQFDGHNSVDGRIELSGESNEKVGMALSIIGQYRDFRSAELYDIGLELGVPIRLRRPTEGSNLYWGVTPVIQAGAGVSPDFAAGGLFMGGGLVNSVAYQLSLLEIGMGNQLIYYGGLPIDDIGGYDFETHLDQLVMKNGLRVAIRPINLIYAEAGLTFTNFLLDDAAIDWFATPNINVGFRLGRWLELRLGYEADLGENEYVGHRGRLELGAYF